MSFIKYRLREVASDFGTSPKEISEIVGTYFEKPKSNTQVLTDEELNVVFDSMTKSHEIESLEQVFAVKPAAEAKPAPQKSAQNNSQNHRNDNRSAQSKPAQNNQNNQNHKENKPAEPERKRERRVVDTSAVQVNSARFDDRVDSLISERAQNFQGGKQRIGGGKNKQQQNKNNKFRGNKARNEEQEKMRRLQMEVARKAPLTVKIPDEITVGELASRMKKTAGEVIKLLLKNGVMAAINQTIDFDTAEFVATELGCKVEKLYF